MATVERDRLRMRADLRCKEPGYRKGRGREGVILVVGGQLVDPVLDVGLMRFAFRAVSVRRVAVGGRQVLQKASTLREECCERRPDLVPLLVDPVLLGVSATHGSSRCPAQLLIGPIVGQEGIEAVQPIADALT